MRQAKWIVSTRESADQSMSLEATPNLSSTMGSPPATVSLHHNPRSESGSLAHARQPDLLRVTQMAAFQASTTILVNLYDEILMRLHWDANAICYEVETKHK